MSTTAITQRITTVQTAEQLLNLRRTTDPSFFLEWEDNLPPLTSAEQESLDQIRLRYRYQRGAGELTEGLVNLIVLSPLLALAGFYDAPFLMRGEAAVAVTVSRLQDELNDEVLRGRLDFLVVSSGLWVTVLESKGTEMNLNLALPQLLTYMMANPQTERPVFGMATNGGEFFFVKLLQSDPSVYDVSRIFSHLPLRNEFYTVLQVLKKIGASLISDG
jgi:hypothetical protein